MRSIATRKRRQRQFRVTHLIHSWWHHFLTFVQGVIWSILIWGYVKTLCMQIFTIWGRRDKTPMRRGMWKPCVHGFWPFGVGETKPKRWILVCGLCVKTLCSWFFAIWGRRDKNPWGCQSQLWYSKNTSFKDFSCSSCVWGHGKSQESQETQEEPLA